MKCKALLYAFSRLTPRMLVYHLRRVARNKLAHQFPKVYASYIERKAHLLPDVGIKTAQLEMVSLVSHFYLFEYAPKIGDIAMGRLEFFGKVIDFGGLEKIDWHHRIPDERDFHLWRMKLGHMGFLSPLISGGDSENIGLACTVLRQFEGNSSFGTGGCFSSYWFPYSVSHRVLALLSSLVVGMNRGGISKDAYACIMRRIRFDVAFIEANIEHELKNNHVERNLAALCLYYDMVGSEGRAMRERLNKEVPAILSACILADGCIAERSAMYQGLAIMALEIFSRARCLDGEVRSRASFLLEKAKRAWLVLTHPDGDIALFNDSWFEEVPKAASIVDRPTFGELEVLEHAGYARLERNDLFLLFDAGETGLSWNPGHGHSDFLSIEVDVCTKRFIVDPGTFQYSTGPRRFYERSAAGHNGPSWKGKEPVEYYGCFKVGRLHAATLEGAERTEEGVAVHGAIDLGDRKAVRHIALKERRIMVTDFWERVTDGGVVNLTIPAQWRLESMERQCAVFCREGILVRLSMTAGVIANVQEGSWASRYLSDETAHILSMEPELTERRISTLKWCVEMSS
jgi:hypothetical protein